MVGLVGFRTKDTNNGNVTSKVRKLRSPTRLLYQAYDDQNVASQGDTLTLILKRFLESAMVVCCFPCLEEESKIEGGERGAVVHLKHLLLHCTH